MVEIAAVLICAGMATVINRWALPKFGVAEIVWVGPVLEEVIKTGAALLLGTSIIRIHIIFGIVEALMDIRTGGDISIFRSTR